MKLQLRSFRAAVDKYLSQEERVYSKYDQGDIILVNNNPVLIYNVISTSNSLVYNTSIGHLDYFKVNSEYPLFKTHTSKLQYYMSNDGNTDPNVLKIALGEESFPKWFEREYKKLNII